MDAICHIQCPRDYWCYRNKNFVKQIHYHKPVPTLDGLSEIILFPRPATFNDFQERHKSDNQKI